MPSLSLSSAHTSARMRRAGKLMKHVAVPLCVAFSIVVTGSALYARSHQMMSDHLREHLRAVAAAAAMQFDGLDVSKFRDPAAVTLPQYVRTVEKLNRLRTETPSIRFAYIMERTKDPSHLRFLADADSLKSDVELDTDGDGTVGDTEHPSFPGDLYAIEENPALQGPAFEGPTVDEEVTVDAWGSFMSGYAPIRNAKGNVVAVLGLDMRADAFERLTYSIFSFESLVLLFCGGGLLALYIGLELWRRRMEAMEQLEADRRALMDLASHQLGAPLTTFKWWLEILKERDGGKLCKESDVCVQMDEGIRRMDEIVAALRSIDINAPESDHHAVSKVGDAVHAAYREALPLMERRKQHCTFELPPEDCSVRLDPALLKGVLEELLENASAYSPEAASILVRITRPRGAVHIDVSDTGDGIAPDDLTLITQKFTRGAGAYRRKPVGNGLGLWIARSIIERAKGRLWIDSTPGKGTTVHIELPAA